MYANDLAYYTGSTEASYERNCELNALQLVWRMELQNEVKVTVMWLTSTMVHMRCSLHLMLCYLHTLDLLKSINFLVILFRSWSRHGLLLSHFETYCCRTVIPWRWGSNIVGSTGRQFKMPKPFPNANHALESVFGQVSGLLIARLLIACGFSAPAVGGDECQQCQSFLVDGKR